MLLTTEIITYHAQDHGEQHYLQTLQRNCPAKTCLQLKIGAQVSISWFDYILFQVSMLLIYDT